MYNIKYDQNSRKYMKRRVKVEKKKVLYTNLMK